MATGRGELSIHVKQELFKLKPPKQLCACQLVRSLCAQPVVPLQLLLHLSVYLALVIMVVGECGVDLRQREVGMGGMDFFGIPAVGCLIHGDFDDFGVSASNPGHSAAVAVNMSNRFNNHNGSLAGREELATLNGQCPRRNNGFV